MSAVFWEHEHAYQPRRILDGFTGEERKEILQKTEYELWTWAQQTSGALYGAALRNLGGVKAGNENPHLVLADLYKSNGMKERAEKEWLTRG